MTYDLAVVSPHSDDACYSLSLHLENWASLGLRILLITCFSESNYAPNTSIRGVAEVSRLRRQEDADFVRRLSAQSDRSVVHLYDLGLSDAPLRPGGFKGRDHTKWSAETSHFQADMIQLTAALSDACDAGVVVLPMGLGHHVDHVLAFRAGLRSAAGATCLLYEDLPYAGWMSAESVDSWASNLAQQGGLTIRPVLTRWPDARVRKASNLAAYRSQLLPDHSEAILAMCDRYGGGERIWAVEGGMPPPAWSSHLGRQENRQDPSARLAQRLQSLARQVLVP